MQRAKASASPPGPSIAGRSLDEDGGGEDGGVDGRMIRAWTRTRRGGRGVSPREMH
jgi:hypothetical protein